MSVGHAGIMSMSEVRFGIAIMATLFSLVSCDHPEVPSPIQEEETTEVDETVAAEIRALAKEHNAVHEWRDDWSSYIYSIEAERRLIREDRRPLLVICRSIDVYRLDETTVINAYDAELGIEFILECEEATARDVIMAGRSELPSDEIPERRCVAVVEPTRVCRRLGEFIANVELIEDYPPDIAEVYLVPELLNTLVVKGRCLALRYLGDTTVSFADVFPDEGRSASLRE